MKKLRIGLVTIVLVVVALAGTAQSKFSIDQVLSAPFPTELTASPAGRRVAWFFNDQGRRNVWGAEAPHFTARQLTNFVADDGEALSELTWSPDGKTIVFVRGEGKNSAGEFPNPTNNPSGTEQAIWAVGFTGGLPRKLGNGASPAISSTGQVAFTSGGQIWSAPLSGSAAAQPLFHARGRNGGAAWSPDDRSLVFVSDREDHSFIALYRPVSNSIRYIAPSVDRDHSPRWSLDGKQIAYVRQSGRGGEAPLPGADNVPNPWSIWVAEVDTLAARQVWASTNTPEGSIPRMAGEDILSWGADGRLVFASEQDGWLHLYSLPSSGGAATLLTPGNCEIEQVAYSFDRRALVYTSNCGDLNRRHLWQVAVSGGTPGALTRGETIEWSPTLLVDGSVAFLRSDARLPGSPYVMNPSGADARNIAAGTIPKDFPAGSLVAPQQVVFKSADGWAVSGGRN
ncbi:MAG: TolB family protein [Gammaproteobacteria bacterium]